MAREGVAGAGIRRRAQDSLGGAISRASVDLPPGFRDSRRASRLPLLLVLPAACRAPVRRRLCSSASLQGTRRASASCRGPVGFPSASLQGPIRLPAGDPSASRRCSSLQPPQPPRSVPSPAHCSFLPLASPPPASLPCSG